MTGRLLAAAVLLSAAPASAAAPSFEALLLSVRQSVLHARADQVRAKDDRLASDLRRLASDVQRSSWDAQTMKNSVSDLRRRAQFPQQPQRPGQPRQDPDPFFAMDLRRLAWDLQDYARRADDQGRTLTRLAQEAKKDPALVGPATDLQRAASDFDSNARWLDSETRWAGMDLRRLGYSMEAWDLERGGSDASRAADGLAQGARRLLAQVQ